MGNWSDKELRKVLGESYLNFHFITRRCQLAEEIHNSGCLLVWMPLGVF